MELRGHAPKTTFSESLGCKRKKAVKSKGGGVLLVIGEDLQVS